MISVAVVGLGKVAWRFDEEPGRRVTWSHVGAYGKHADRCVLVGAVDPDPAAREAFAARFPDVATYPDIASLAARARPRVLSICTPAGLHRETLEQTLALVPEIEVVWCEKPLATSLNDAIAMVDLAARRGVRVVVSHVRRWTPIWREARAVVDAGELGVVRVISVRMPNRLWSIGSHAIDLAAMLGGEVDRVVGLDVPSLTEDGEPARPCLLSFSSGAHGAVIVTGTKHRLLVEAEVIGDAGRMLVDETRRTISRQVFGPSPYYTGYMELAPPTVATYETLLDVSPFEAVASECLGLIDHPEGAPTVSDRDALAGMRILDALGRLDS